VHSPKKPRRFARPKQINDGAGTLPHAIEAPHATPVAPSGQRPTKRNLIFELLCAEGGTSLAAIVGATGWLPHTARAALTSLRKKGHVIVRDKVDGVTRYAIAPVAAELPNWTRPWLQ
jgi:hypothetical protein